MREGNEEQMQHLSGVKPQQTATKDAPAAQEGAAEEASARPQGTPSNFVRIPKTLVTDIRVFGMLSKHPVSLDSPFIEGKTPVDILLEKQLHALSDPVIHIEFHYPQERLLGISTHTTRNTFEVKVRPFRREEDRVRLVSPQEEEDALNAVELPYRKMPGVSTSWATQSIHVGDEVRECNVLIVSLDKSADAARAKDVLLHAMHAKDKGRSLS